MVKPIKSLLLSAGYGTRLRPLTNDIPKCLVKVNNKPVIEYWLDKLEEVGAENVLINTHYLYKQVNKFINKHKNRKYKLLSTYEKTLLGTAGTLIANHKFFQDSLGILIHVDNFTNFNLKDLIESHYKRPKNCILTMLTFKSNNPQECGIIEINSEGIVQSFFEKVENPPSSLANGAVYLFESEFLEWLMMNHPEATDFSKDVLPNLLGKIFTYQTKSVYIDIGTREALYQANKIAKKLN